MVPFSFLQKVLPLMKRWVLGIFLQSKSLLTTGFYSTSWNGIPLKKKKKEIPRRPNWQLLAPGLLSELLLHRAVHISKYQGSHSLHQTKNIPPRSRDNWKYAVCFLFCLSVYVWWNWVEIANRTAGPFESTICYNLGLMAYIIAPASVKFHRSHFTHAVDLKLVHTDWP